MSILKSTPFDIPSDIKKHDEVVPIMNVTSFHSLPIISPFALEYNFLLGETEINDVDFDKVKNILLDKEKEILELPCKYYEDSVTGETKVSDGDTGLGNSVTSRFRHYNVLRFEDSEFKKIKDNILNCYNKFIEEINLRKLTKGKVERPNELYIQCWYNILRKGQKIKTHVHDCSNSSYLGGHINVTTNNTHTSYIISPDQLTHPEIYSNKTKKGKLTLFQANIPHFVNATPDDHERVTIAFDLVLNKRISDYYHDRLF